jgi:hypothetical protein
VARLGVIGMPELLKKIYLKVEKPNTKLGIGFDQLPIGILTSNLLTNNEKAQLANINMLPDDSLKVKFIFLRQLS